MPDKPKDEGKKEEKRGEPISFHTLPAMIAQSLMDIVVKQGLPFAWSKGQEAVEHRIQEGPRRDRNKHYFMAAMVKLRVKNGTAADVIDDFDRNYLKTDTDREDFQVNAARVGGDTDDKMSDTVDFLEQLAAIPDHDARYALLVARGFLGARSMDALERVVTGLQWLRDNVGSLPANMVSGIGEQITNVDTWLKSAAVQNWQPGKDAADKAKDQRQKAINRFKAAKSRL